LAQFFGEQLSQIVNRNDTGQCPLLVNDGHSADAMCPHLLYRFEDSLILTDHGYFAADQITRGDRGGIELRCDHANNDIRWVIRPTGMRFPPDSSTTTKSPT
jgi:hypothetical protein